MSEKLGAKHLVLLSRSGTNAPGAEQLVRRIEEQGSKVKVVKCDVANTQDLNTQLDSVTADMPPVRGVIQAAMVLQVRKAHFSRYHIGFA